MPLDERLSAECADWIAERLTEEFGGFIAAEVIDSILEYESEIRVDHSAPEMGHDPMAGHLIERLRAEGAPVETFGGITRELLIEILYWEDEFLSLAGSPRRIR
jgi:hypothetical protein